MVSTTNPDALDDETKQRFLLLTIDETPEQTQRILQAQRTKNSHRWYEFTSDENVVTKHHHNMQRLLKPLTVTFPDEIKVHWPYGCRCEFLRRSSCCTSVARPAHAR